MNNKFTTAYFESAKLYTEKYDFKYMDANESRDRMHVCFNINDPFFKPLGAEITSILEVNDDIAFNFYVFVDAYSEDNKENLRKTAEKYKTDGKPPYYPQKIRYGGFIIHFSLVFITKFRYYIT